MTVKSVKRQPVLRRNQSPLKRDWHENWPLYALLIPVLAYFIIFSYVPMSGILMAFQDYKVTRGLWAATGSALKISSCSLRMKCSCRHCATALPWPFAI